MSHVNSFHSPLPMVQFWLVLLNCSILSYFGTFAIVAGENEVGNGAERLGYILGSGGVTGAIIWLGFYALCLRGARRWQRLAILAGSLAAGCLSAYLNVSWLTA